MTEEKSSTSHGSLPFKIEPFKNKVIFLNILAFWFVFGYTTVKIFLFVWGVPYYKTESLWKRFITWMDMHENPIIKHLNSSKTLL